MPREVPLAGDGLFRYFRNGRKMQDPLPLWQGTEGRRTGVPREVPLAGGGQFRGFRNGRKMRVPLPLWQGAEDLGGPGSASRKERPVPGLPQRQENAGFAAVVEWGGGPGQYGTAVLHGHSSRRASYGRIPETFHTETRAARALTANTTAATTRVTISADRKGEVSTGQGARELSGNAGILT